MRTTVTVFSVGLLFAAILCAAPAMAKKHDGQGSGGQAPSYGPPSYAGPKGDQTPPYGPPGYAGPKGNQAVPSGQPGYARPGNNAPGMPQGMPPGQQKRAAKHHKKHKNGPPDHAPAWGYRNQQ